MVNHDAAGSDGAAQTFIMALSNTTLLHVHIYADGEIARDELSQGKVQAVMAPGMFTFASIFLIMMAAQSFTQDRENGMMKRIRTTPITPSEFMTGQVFGLYAHSPNPGCTRLRRVLFDGF
ncbi:MAG: ABC transporter permease [Candidatus Bathyarchaeia archaeon]